MHHQNSPVDSRNHSLEVRKATHGETDAVLSFYSTMIDEMKGTDFDILWKHDVHPTNESLIDAIENGQLYIGIASDGCIACGAVVNHEQAPGYEDVPWAIAASVQEVGILHSVATLPAYHGRGFATKLMEGIINTSREEGLLALRLDTFMSNNRAQGLYAKSGFTNLGHWPIFYEDLGTIDLVMFEYVL